MPDIGYYLVTKKDTNHPSIEALKSWLKMSANKISLADTPNCISWINPQADQDYSIDYSGDIFKLVTVDSKDK